MSTVHQILDQTKKTMKALELKEAVCVFDQAFIAKATELVWQNQEQFTNLILRMGAFQSSLNHKGPVTP